MNPLQFRNFVLRPTLSDMCVVRPRLADSKGRAERLIMGTIAQESQFHHLHQLDGGPACGIIQMEPVTFKDILTHFAPARRMLDGLGYDAAKVFDLHHDLRLNVIMCRLRYMRVPDPLPGPDPWDLAVYWKEHYNTPLGDGTVEQFVADYERYVEPLPP